MFKALIESLKPIIEAINEINTNVWGFMLVLLGATIVLRHADNIGAGIIGGGLSLLNASANRQITKTTEGIIQVNASK